jgi:DNA repair exonuclease SbcCD ATPase subunit
LKKPYPLHERAELNAQSLHQILTEASSRDPQNQQAIVQKDNQIEAQQDSLVPLMIKIFNKLAQPSSEQETLQLRVRVERLRRRLANLIIHINKDNRLKNLAYQAQAIKAEAEQLAELSDPALKELEPEIAEQENQLEQLEIKFKFPERIDTLAAESQSLLEEIQTVTELDEYEIDALSKPDSLNKDDIADKQRAQLKQKARDKLQPEAQKLVQEVNKFKKLLGNLDSLAQREDEIEEQENNYRELKTKRDKYKKLLGLDNSSPDTVERCCKLNKKEEKPQRYKFRLVETMEDYEKHYPCAVRDAIDAAQESVTQLNKETSRYGDGSVAYAAIAEQVNGSKEEGKFDAPVAALPELGGQTHLGKCKEFILGLSRSKRELERYVEKKYLTERAIDILRREEDKLKQALKWCKDYRAGDYPELPSWAKTYREQLRKLGLKERGETFN